VQTLTYRAVQQIGHWANELSAGWTERIFRWDFCGA
jgi:hypothetical protein